MSCEMQVRILPRRKDFRVAARPDVRREPRTATGLATRWSRSWPKAPLRLANFGETTEVREACTRTVRRSGRPGGTVSRPSESRKDGKVPLTSHSPSRPRMPAMLKGFGRRPLAKRLARRRGPASESLTRRKPREGWGPVGARCYGDFRVADRARRLRVKLESADGVDRQDDSDRIGSRECGGRARIGRVIGVCRGCEAIAVVVRGAAASECDRRCWRAGGAAVMRCRS